MSGSEANYSGQNFEQQVGFYLAAQCNLEIVDWRDINTGDIESTKNAIKGKNLLVRNMRRVRRNQQRDYAVIEWYIALNDTYVECKYQSVTGTASQKIPYAMIDAVLNSDDGSSTMFLLGGDKLTAGLDTEYYDYVIKDHPKVGYTFVGSF